MQMISVAGALRGRWAAHPLGWALLLVPIILLVTVQEATTSFPSYADILLSALVQHVIAGGVIVGVGSLALRWLTRVPLGVVAAIWVLSGVTRGLIGGWFAQLLAAADPQYGYRIAYWVIVTLVWMPLFTYLLAQFEFRRQLLGELGQLDDALAAQRRQARATVEERAAQLVSAVRDAVSPLITEMHSTLASASEHDGAIALEGVSERLQLAAETARRVIEPPAAQQHIAPLAEANWSPLIEALAFSRARPAYVALLTSVAVAALFVPDSLRDNGPREVIENLQAIAAGGIVLALGLTLARLATHFTAVHATAIFLLAAAASQGTLLAVDLEPDNVRELALIAAFPLAFGSAAAMLGSAVGIALGNLKLIAALDSQTEQLATLIAESEAREHEIVERVSAVLHGPVLGRLSACIMALNFYLSEPEQSRGLRRKATMDGVRAHLELVVSDLEKIVGPEK
jgi:hypothetical protein